MRESNNSPRSTNPQCKHDDAATDDATSTPQHAQEETRSKQAAGLTCFVSIHSRPHRKPAGLNSHLTIPAPLSCCSFFFFLLLFFSFHLTLDGLDAVSVSISTSHSFDSKSVVLIHIHSLFVGLVESD